MNYHPRLRSVDLAQFEPVDILLADVAVRIQLPAGKHDRAVSRYETMQEWIDRDGSPLRHLVEVMYGQGSMATGSTIASRLTNDEHDIDVVVQLAIPADTPPGVALDVLFEAIRGERGSRYYSVTKRQTRCVTVAYASDRMHLDLTPAVLLPQRKARTSHIFNHRPETPQDPGFHVIANPFGFAEWFNARTPLDHAIASLVTAREDSWRVALAKAHGEEVPQQVPITSKSKAVIVLQLLKRFRNVRYDRRKGRKPPSIMMAKLIADDANQTRTLSEELVFQAEQMLATLEAAHTLNTLVRVTNPECFEDLLTDRWPGTRAAQAEFISDLRYFIKKIDRLIEGCDLSEMQEIMRDLFGEYPTLDVFRKFIENNGHRQSTGQSLHIPGAGRLGVVTGVAAGLVRPVAAQETRAHTNFGGTLKPWR